MLHEAVLRELLEDEIAVARDRIAGRLESLSLARYTVYCHFGVPGAGEYRLRLLGRAYDAEPFRVAVVDSEDTILPAAQWPPGLYHSHHPVLNVPFACVRGTYEYHAHPSHLADIWDRYRHQIRLADLLDHLLRRCGR